MIFKQKKKRKKLVRSFSTLFPTKTELFCRNVMKIPLMPIAVAIPGVLLVNLAGSTVSPIDAGFLLDRTVANVSMAQPTGLANVAGAYDFITNPDMSAFFIALLIIQVGEIV